MANDTELLSNVRETMAEVFGVDEAELPDEISQENFSRWTSLQHMTLLAVLEENFGITLEMEEMVSMTSLPKIINVLEKHGAKV